MNNQHYVFVYGTLKSGQYNNRVMTLGGNAKLLYGQAEVRGRLYDLGPFPAMTQEGGKSVKGEVWVVDDDVLERLDHLEGHPQFYKRVQEPLLYSPDFKVWVYVMPKDRLAHRQATPLPDGIWPNKR